MKDLIAKYRSLIACALAALVTLTGCHAQQVNAGVREALIEAKAAGGKPVTVKEAPTKLFGVVRGKPTAWVYDPKLDVVTFVDLTKFGATGDNPAGWIIDPTSGALTAPSGKVIAGVSFKKSPDAISLTSIATKSGLAQTVDGVALSSANMRVWQLTVGASDGCYVTASGAWARCDEAASGADLSGAFFAVGHGTANKGLWIVTNTAGAGISGTSTLTATNLSTLGGGGAVSSVFARTGAVVAAQGDYTAAQVGAISGVDVYVASTGALPTYTANNGTLGVGATLTANANGAFITIDGRTLVANDPIKGLFYLRHGASAVDNGVYMLTTQGSGGAPWVATRYTLLDQAAELPGSKLRVTTSGSEFVYTALATPVMGTTHLFWKEIGTRIGPQYGVRYQSDFGFNQTVATTALIPNTDLVGVVQGSSTMTTNVTNTSSQRGIYSCGAGTSATGVSGFAGAFTAAVTQPDGGDAITISQDMGWDWTWTVAQPVLSDGTNTFSVMVGWSKTRSNSQKISSDYVGFISDSTSGVSATHWLTALAAAGVSTGTVIDSGVTITAGQYYRLRSRKDAGDTLIHFYIDGVEIGTGSSTNVSTDFLSMIAMVFKSIGPTNVNAARFGSVRVDIDFPQGLAA